MIEVMFFSGKSNIPLAKEIASKAKTKLGRIELKKFSDGESYCRLLENVKGKTVVIIQCISFPFNENFIDLMLLANAAKENKAREVYAFIPYLGYARQDRVTLEGEPVSAKVIANSLKSIGIKKAFVLDIHSRKAASFFGKQLNQLEAFGVLANYFKKKHLKSLSIVSPDQGALSKAKKYARLLKAGTVLISKKRVKAEHVAEMKLKGNVKGKNCLIIDDIIGTGGTVIRASELLLAKGARNVFVAATHGVLAGNALTKFQKSAISQILITNSIQQKKRSKKLKVISCASIYAQELEKLKY